jgi:hypothetical protein
MNLSALSTHPSLRQSRYFYEPAEAREKDELMDLRLVYKGPLPAASASDTRARDKQRIRREFHPQLKEYYRQTGLDQRRYFHGSGIENSFTRSGFTFVTPIQKANCLGCCIDILFLRRDGPGNVVSHGGDIDNRIKVLFDALRIPSGDSELDGTSAEEGEHPFYCLLEDDALVSELHVTTDKMLIPVEQGERVNDVLLVIRVQATLSIGAGF